MTGATGAILVGTILSRAGFGQPRTYSEKSAEVTADGGANARGHVPAAADAR